MDPYTDERTELVSQRRFAFHVFLIAVTAAGCFTIVLRQAGERSPSAANLRTNAVSAHTEAFESGDAGLDNDWFMTQRSYPDADIPRQAAERMRQTMRSRFSSKERIGEVNSASAWSLLGPSNIGGRIMALLIHPTNPDIIYAGAASGGLWKSTDFGGTWANVFNESFSIGALAFEPGDPNTIYVGTGENSPAGVATYPGNGVWRSTDAGATWANIGLTDIGYTAKIAINPLNPQTIYVAAVGLYRARTTERGVFKSTNRGATWNQVLFLNDTTCGIDVAIDPLDTGRVFAAMWTRYRTPHVSVITGAASGLYLSDDGGTSWLTIAGAFPNNDPNLGRISFTFAPSNPTVMYALTQSGVGWGGMYKSTNRGNTWALGYDGTGAGEGQVWYNNVVTVDPMDPTHVWAGMTTLYASTNGGTTFGPASISGFAHPDYHVIVYAPSDPNKMVIGNDGGIFTSTDGGSSWEKSYNLPITQFYAGAVSAQNSNRILGGAQDNNSMQTSNGVVNNWTYMYCCDGFYCLIDPTDSNYVYAEAQNGGLGYSINGGVGFFGGTNGMIGGDRWNWETPIAMDLEHPKTLYTGSQRVYRTTNHMQVWTAISGDLTFGNGGRVGTISTIDVSQTDSSVIYVGTDDGRVWVTTNGGGAWTDISSTLPLHWVTRVTVDPDSSRIAYVTLSGFIENDYAGHIYRTTNFGNTWTNIGTGLPNIPLNDVVVDPANRSTLFIATDLNVMRSTNLGASWSVLGTGLPEVPVHDLAFHTGDRKLVAFTHGRSAFRYTLLPAGIVSVDVALNKLWNLVANPVTAENDSVQVLYPGAQSAAFRYTPGGSYAQDGRLANGAGYWIKFSAASGQHASIDGTALTVDSIAVSAGWNMIGSITDPVPVATITSDPPGLVTSQFFAYAGSYLTADSIQPGSGYWVKVGGAGTLILSTTPAALPSARIRVIPTDEAPPAPPAGDETAELLPIHYALLQAYPNPFNPSTVIRYELPAASAVTLTIYDMLGRAVATLVNGTESAGMKSASWNAAGSSSGVYLCRLEARGLDGSGAHFASTQKLVLIK